jgi:hypothetical protein
MTQFHEVIMPGRHDNGNKEVLGAKPRPAHYFKK